MSNPVMKNIYRDRADLRRIELDSDDVLTRNDVFSATATALSVAVIIGLSVVFIGLNVSPGLASVMALAGVGGIVILSIVMIASPIARRGSPVMAGLMSAAQGLMAGGMTFAIGSQQVGGAPGWGIVAQAIMGTVALFFIALTLYSTGVIKVTQKFTAFITFAVAGMAGLYLINLVISLFLGKNLLFAEGPIPIIIAVVAIVLGTLTLIQNFSDVEVMVDAGSDRRVRWALATGILVSLVWLYVELLRLLYLVRR